MKANTTCRICGLPIRWCVVEPSGKRLAIDPEPSGDGNVWVKKVLQGTPQVVLGLSHDDIPRFVLFTYVPHTVTCITPAEDDIWEGK